jgi:hypothetical protein
MLLRYFISILLAVSLCFVLKDGHAQTTLQGVVKSKELSAPIPYVNIGIKKKNVGTAANGEGVFKLDIPATLLADTLTFSAVGYYDLSIPVSQLLSAKETDFFLTEKITQINEVVVRSRVLKLKRRGTTSQNPIVSGLVQTREKKDIVEHAKYISINKHPAEILSASFYVKYSSLDSANFRIKFYDLQNGEPGDLLLENSIIKKMKLTRGWHTIDLQPYNLFIDKDFFISLEYLPNEGQLVPHPFMYGGNLGGIAFTRNVSLGAWSKFTGARLSMYVTLRQ